MRGKMRCWVEKALNLEGMLQTGSETYLYHVVGGPFYAIGTRRVTRKEFEDEFHRRGDSFREVD